MIARDNNNQFAGIQCDECGVMAPPADEMLKHHHGLRSIGWYASGGQHICPAHPHPRSPEQIEADKQANGCRPQRNEGSVR